MGYLQCNIKQHETGTETHLLHKVCKGTFLQKTSKVFGAEEVQWLNFHKEVCGTQLKTVLHVQTDKLHKSRYICCLNNSQKNSTCLPKSIHTCWEASFFTYLNVTMNQKVLSLLLPDVIMEKLSSSPEAGGCLFSALWEERLIFPSKNPSPRSRINEVLSNAWHFTMLIISSWLARRYF